MDADRSTTSTITDERVAAIEDRHQRGDESAEPPIGLAVCGVARSAALPGMPLVRRTGTLISIEGVWGAGKTTVSRLLVARLSAAGFDACVVHDGPQPGVIGVLSEFLDTEPLRRRTGTGGYEQPHHASIDVFLRMCREAHRHTRVYRPALEQHDVVILDQGVFTKLAYYQAVLQGQHHGSGDGAFLDVLLDCVRPWFLVPDRAFYLDVPWPLARERSARQGADGPLAGSLERLLFLPGYDNALRSIASALPQSITRIAAGASAVDAVVTAIEREMRTVLHIPAPPGSFT